MGLIRSLQARNLQRARLIDLIYGDKLARQERLNAVQIV